MCLEGILPGSSILCQLVVSAASRSFTPRVLKPHFPAAVPISADPLSSSPFQLMPFDSAAPTPVPQFTCLPTASACLGRADAGRDEHFTPQPCRGPEGTLLNSGGSVPRAPQEESLAWGGLGSRSKAAEGLSSCGTVWGGLARDVTALGTELQRSASSWGSAQRAGELASLEPTGAEPRAPQEDRFRGGGLQRS